MTRPDQPAPAAALDDALFGAEAADYARHRPGLPDGAVHLLAAPQHGVTDAVLLDLGTGTGQVPRALLPVLRRLVHIDLVDVNQRMLRRPSRARTGQWSVRGQPRRMRSFAQILFGTPLARQAAWLYEYASLLAGHGQAKGPGTRAAPATPWPRRS
ncbi:hypothetical protein [Streptomyces sp. c-19]|uniref:hypothetical protein n=1 Tax=Streptomyces sp. c-19 TaxID=2789275 RepID=UPI00397ED039